MKIGREHDLCGVERDQRGSERAGHPTAAESYRG
jgi:hypothetical protein